MHPPLPFRGVALAVCAFGLLAAPGCSSHTVQRGSPDNLQKIADAYLAATQKNNRPPKSADELKPFLKDVEDKEGVFVSPNDSQPYVIIWGTDPRQGMDVNPLVIAYEKNGSGGQRFVFTAMGVMLKTDEDFANANFPKGHRPS